MLLWLYLEYAAWSGRRRRQRSVLEQPTPHVCQACDRPLVAA